MSIDLYSIYLSDYMDNVYKWLEDQGIKYIALNGYVAIRYTIRISNNRIDLVKDSVDQMIKVVLSNGYNVMTSVIKGLYEDYKSVLENVVKTVKSSKRGIKYTPPSNKIELYDVYPGGYDPSVFNVNASIDYITHFMDDLSEIFERVSGSISIKGIKHIIKTSYGREGEYKLTSVLLNLRGFKDKGFTYTLNRAATSLSKLNYDSLLEEAREYASINYNVEHVEESVHKVIFTPLAFSNILYYLGTLLSGYSIYSGYSPFIDLLGEEISSKPINIYDDPKEEGNPYPSLFDEEGIERRRVYLVKDGVLSSYILNILYRGVFKQESTGHAGPEYPYPYTLILDGEHMDVDDLFNEVKEGILVTNIWNTSFANIREGTFSSTQRDIGFYIRKGSIRGCFIGARLNMNIIDVFRNLIGLAGERVWVKPWDTDLYTKSNLVGVDNIRVTTGFW
ncbi:MAG TPA: TldD/PmbA family protein [Thermoprotei archaeon]|nr:TldD/PmbA family protein [Thermoprotei archaeon]